MYAPLPKHKYTNIKNERHCASRCTQHLSPIPHALHCHHPPLLRHSLEVELSEGLHKGTALNVTHSPTQLNHTDIWHTRHAIHRDVSHALDPVLNGISDVGHDLQTSHHSTAHITRWHSTLAAAPSWRCAKTPELSDAML